jgi:catechol 2,3-dioxygenase-like lactoylglutathione lyase family enzyme
MLNHVSIGVRAIPASKRFYDAALGAIGYKCLSEDAASLGYGASQPFLWIVKSERPVPADSKSGLHFCFDAPDAASVKKFHSMGVSHGGRDNGAPSLRADYGPDYYAAFLIDPDGYRLEAYYRGKA